MLLHKKTSNMKTLYVLLTKRPNLKLLGTVSIFSISFFSNSAVIYTNSSTGNDISGNGTSSAPYQSFYKAYTMAVSGDEIVATGIFTWTNAIEIGDISETGFIIDKNLIIRGSGRNETFFQAASQRGVADRSVFFVNPNRTVTFNSLTIRYGRVTTTKLGGGLTLAGSYCGNYPCSSITGTAILNYVDVVDNDANGVINSAMHMSGGIYLREASTITLNHVNVSTNDCTCRLYSAGGIAGGEQSQSLTINNSTISNNTASSTYGSTWAYDYSAVAGGIALQRFGRLLMTNVTVSGNNTNHYGGGINAYYQNWATLTNVTIANNNADLGAGGILWDTPSQTAYSFYKIYLKNTLIANNTGNATPSDFYSKTAFSGSMVEASYSIFENNTNTTLNGTGIKTGEDPNLFLESSLSLNESTNGTKTLAISNTSSAKNSGNGTAHGYSSYQIAPPSTDQRDLLRDATPDIGAYEFVSALPVELSWLELSCYEAELSLLWSTDSESNSDYFLVEVSNDGITWDEKTKLMAAGNSSESINYSYSFPKERESDIYVRLSQFDLNGNSETYEPLRSSCVSTSNSMKLYPNPSNGEFYLQINNEENSDLELAVFNSAGNKLKSMIFTCSKGTNSILLDFSELAPGLYEVVNMNSGNRQTLSIY